jgi:hypothetical protein
MQIGRLALAISWMLAVCCGASRAQERHSHCLIGIDHMPTVVRSLDDAVATYRLLGFSLKPGRPHANGLRNAHVKFEDGSGIELISPPEQPGDALSRNYRRRLDGEGEGPAYIAFHARDTQGLIAALRSSNIPFERDGELVSPSAAELQYIFFVRDNRSATDRPEHFAHPNTAAQMTEVWLALDGPAGARLGELLLALGAVKSSAPAPQAIGGRAVVFSVLNGRVIVVPSTRRLQVSRPIIGAGFRVRNPEAARRFTSADTVPPSRTHGLWLQFSGTP